MELFIYSRPNVHHTDKYRYEELARVYSFIDFCSRRKQLCIVCSDDEVNDLADMYFDILPLIPSRNLEIFREVVENRKPIKEVAASFNLTRSRIDQIVYNCCTRILRTIIANVTATNVSETSLEYISTSLGDCKLSARASNALRRKGIDTVEQLKEFVGDNPDKLRCLRNIGNATYREIMGLLAEY